MKKLLAALGLCLTPLLAAAQVKVNALPNGSTIGSSDFTICDQGGTTNKCTFSQVSTWTRSQTTKTDVGLANVENTALSTWAGSTNLTTLGTIATGTWNGSLLGSTYGGTGNAFFAVSGPATSIKTYTLPNVSTTLLTTNAAVTVAQGGTGLTSGTSGGVPYYSASGTLASSAALTVNGLVIGGGAGASPSTLTNGTTGQLLTATSGSAPSFQSGVALNGLPAATAVAVGDLVLIYSQSDTQAEAATAAQVEGSMVLSATSSAIGGSALVAGQCSAGTVTVTGATTSMVASVSPSADPDSSLSTGIAIYAFVSASNTVTIRVCAIVAVTPASVTYNVRVVK